MKRPTILLRGQIALGQRAIWGADYDILLCSIGGDLPPDPALSDVEVLVCAGEPLPNALLGQLPSLKLVACFSTGFGGIDLAYLRDRGIALTNAAGVNAHDVADHAVALFMTLAHRVSDLDHLIRNGGWRANSAPRSSLRGRRCGIVGFGRTGQAIATRLASHEIAIEWWGPNPKTSPFPRASSLADLARDNDTLFISARDAAENTHMIDKAILDLLGPRGLLVNVARGSLIDEAALRHALADGIIAGAALDVFDEEPLRLDVWADVPNVILTPHVAGYTIEAGQDMSAQLIANVRRHFAGEPLLTPVAGS